MHVAADLNLSWFLQFVVTVFICALGLRHLVKNTYSKYFVADAGFDSSSTDTSSLKVGFADRYRGDSMNNPKDMKEKGESCPVCGNFANKRCSRCKAVSYCSAACQTSHWNAEHKTKCKKPHSSWRGNKASGAISLVPSSGISEILNQTKRILFPYEEFVEFFNWSSTGFPPCGLLNCGNSCFANVVLQCLTYTKPLVAYLLEKGHRRECRRNDWCFLCEFQTHLEKASRSQHPFSPINILSRLPNLGGNLGHGSQEDAHEFMRFAIDTMQSVCLDEFGGEKAVHPTSQETTLIQHIFGGHLQSQVICTQCNSTSSQLENMMDLTVEIQGDAASLEECLDQFTAKEWLHGENMYKCDRCNDYVTAWKRLTIQMPPNILTIALKRFQSGRFGKLNKRVTFPETLDLRPYMSKPSDEGDSYKLYAVIVHVDMLNASFFGHYICYIKDFVGNWYRIDDCKVARVDLDEVLSQGAYMLLYSRVCPRATSLYPNESEKEGMKKNIGKTDEVQSSIEQNGQCPATKCLDGAADSHELQSPLTSVTETTSTEEDISSVTNSEDVREKVDSGTVSPDLKDVTDIEARSCSAVETDASSLGVSHRSQSGDSLTCTSKEAGANIEETSAFSDAKVESGRMKSATSSCIGYTSNNLTSCMENNVSEKFKMPSDHSTSSSEPGLPSSYSSSAKNGTVKSKGTVCAGPKLKPLFAPGFLEKSTKNKKQRGPSNGFPNSDLRRQNGTITDQESPHFVHKNESTHQADGLHQVSLQESAGINHHRNGDTCGINESIAPTMTDNS